MELVSVLILGIRTITIRVEAEMIPIVSFNIVDSLPLSTSMLVTIKNEDTNFVYKDIEQSIEKKSFLRKDNKGKLDWYGDDMLTKTNLLPIRETNLKKLSSFEDIKLICDDIKGVL